jgi:hypothetical protein
MWEPPWKALVEELKAERVRSPYQDRLASRLDIAAPAPSLERQLLEEMACALRGSADKVTHSLQQLHAAELDIESASTPKERRERISAYNQQRKRAVQARWELMIHREALGFRRHQLEEFF